MGQQASICSAKRLAHVFSHTVLLLCLTCAAGASKSKPYTSGKLIAVSELKLDVGALLPVHLSYTVQIEADNLIYSVSIDKHPYDLEWIVGNLIQFRVDNRRIYLKQLNGKELKCKLLLVTAISPGSPLNEIPEKPLRAGDVCLGIGVIAARAQDISGHKPNKSTLSAHNVPGTTKVRVQLSLERCPRPEPAFLQRPEFRFDDDFIQSLHFEAFWKVGLTLNKTELRVLTQAQIKPPSSFGREAAWWEYELETAADVNAGDIFVLHVLSADGTLIDRFSGQFLKGK
jgi:hypothetical protein